MSEIAVDFLAGTGPASALIERFGFPQGYSHAASVLKDGTYLDARSDVVGGVPPGVRIRDPKKYRWIRKRRVSLEVTPAEYDEWEKNLKSHLTDQYDKRAILGFLEGKSMHTAGQWICSALAVNSSQHVSRLWEPFKHLGYIPFPLVIAAHEISPDMLLPLYQTAGYTIGPEVLASRQSTQAKGATVGKT